VTNIPIRKVFIDFIFPFIAEPETEGAQTQRTPVAGTARRPPQKSAKPRPIGACLVGPVKMKLAVSQLNRSQSYANWFVFCFLHLFQTDCPAFMSFAGN
jgi:hypothetical protein